MTNSAVPTVREEVDLVTRSDVPPGLPYNEYKQALRYDFFHACAYCTMSEAEAAAVRFTIDHYEPQSSRPELANEYSNLMYACDQCNTLKGPRTPPNAARSDGIRFFRPDVDRYIEHFERVGVRLNGLTKLADFTIHSVDLNRLSLRRLREVRQRLTDCSEMITAGIRAMRKFRFDQLPPEVRKTAMDTVKQFKDAEETAQSEIDEVLREHAKSSLIDEDPDAEAHKRDRLKRLKGTESLYPGELWRSRR